MYGRAGYKRNPSITSSDYSTKKKCEQDPGCLWNKSK